MTVTVPARAALAGNPSDGHGGAVVAVPLPCVAATVRVHPADHFSVLGAEPGDDLWELVAASLRAADELTTPPAGWATVAVEVSTTIPRSVGLAGSSAIVIAALRACAAARADDLPADWSADPTALAVIARHAEVEGLGIAAGLQDRLVQAFGRPLVMEFGPDATSTVLGQPCGSVASLPTPPGRFVLAHRAASAASSGEVHGGLAQRDDTGPLMRRLADAARQAASAIRAADAEALGAAMDLTFELRSELLELDPSHVEMIEVARSAGGHANYTGSGGAVIVACADEQVAVRAADALRGLDGCVVTTDPLTATV